MKKKLHILFLCGWYPSRVLPNNGDFIQRHAEAVSLKHEVTVIHIITDKNCIENIEINFQVIAGIKTYIAYIKHTENPVLKFFRFYKAYQETLKRIPLINFVHLNSIFPMGIFALLLKWKNKISYIISEHWSGYHFPRNKSIGLIETIITKLIVKNANYVCPVSKNLQGAMINFGLDGNYFPVPNVVDTSYFNLSKDSDSSKFIITHISGMGDDCKNITGILNVIEKLQNKIPSIVFNLIGEDSKKYIPQIESLNIKNINIIDQIPHLEVAEYLKKSNVFVLFSNYENLPCVILESFACGLPVVSTNVGGISEYFPQDFGTLINPRDEISLEKSILKIYNSETKLNKVKMHLYAKENFSKESISTTFSNLYNKSLK